METEFCSTLSAWECTSTGFGTLCGVDSNGKCISRWVACDGTQQAYFDKKKADFESNRVPSVCLTDINGKYPKKVNHAFLRQYEIIVATIVLLFLAAVSTLAVAIAVGAGVQGANAGDTGKSAFDGTGFRSWES